MRPTRRPPSTTVRIARATIAVIVVIASGLLVAACSQTPAPAPAASAAAAPMGRHFGLDFERVELSADGGSYLVDPLVYPLPVDPARTLREQAVLAPHLRLAPGMQAIETATHGAYALQLVVTVTLPDAGVAQLEVRSAGQLVERRSQEFDLADPGRPRLAPRDTELAADGRPLPPGDPAQAEPVSIDLTAAPVGELLRAIAMVANLALEVAPGVAGEVTLHVEDMPWNEVLDAAAAQAGFVWRVEAGRLIVAPQ